MYSTKFARVPRAAASVPAPRICSKLRMTGLLPLLGLLGFFGGEVQATPLLDGSYHVNVLSSFGSGLTSDTNFVTNQPIANQTTSFSAMLAPGPISAASALTLNILNDDGSGHARISANTAGNYFRPGAGPELEADASFGLFFSVSEAVIYSITGSYLFDLERTAPGQLQSGWEAELRASSGDLFLEHEDVQGAGASAMHLNLVDEGTTIYGGAGSLTGTLLPGQSYRLDYFTHLFAGGSSGDVSGVSSSTFSIDFVKAPPTDPVDPPPANSVPDTAPTGALLGVSLLGLGLARRHARPKPAQTQFGVTSVGVLKSADQGIS